MPTMYDAEAQELITKAAEELKKVPEIKPPEWAPFAKTGMHKERPPVNNDWWYMRTASVLRAVYRLGPVGVSKLRTKYGGKKNRGVKQEHFYKGSGSIVRKIIQQLEKEGFVKTDLKSQHKGRLITAKGKKFLDDAASKIAIAKPRIKEAKKEEKEPAAKEQKSHASKAPEQKPAHDKVSKEAGEKAQAEIKSAKEKPQEKAAEAQ